VVRARKIQNIEREKNNEYHRSHGKTSHSKKIYKPEDI
jgi:hypothetical protein